MHLSRRWWSAVDSSFASHQSTSCSYSALSDILSTSRAGSISSPSWWRSPTAVSTLSSTPPSTAIFSRPSDIWYRKWINTSLKFRPPVDMWESSVNVFSVMTQVTWPVVTDVRSESFGLVTERRHYNAPPIYTCRAFMLRKFCFLLSSMVSRAFSALCARYACIRRSSIILSSRLPLW